MYKNILLALFCLVNIPCHAIEYYHPGDTLWVWAKNGLNIREKPDALSKIIGKAPNGSFVLSLDYLNTEFPYSVEEIKKSTRELAYNAKQYLPNLELTGYWAKVTYNGIVGYVFDVYLSKLQTFIGHQYDPNNHEDFHVWSLKKQSKVLKQIKVNENKNEQKFVQYIFDNGHIINNSGGSNHWEKEMLFSNGLSITEGYLIYLHTMKLENDVLLEKGEDFLKFEVETGILKIKKVGSFLIISEEHKC